MVLPEGMQTVDFSDCWRITGTAELGMSKVHTFLIGLEASRTRFLIPHFLIFLLLPFSLSRRGYRADEPSRGHAVRELSVLHGHHRYG